MKKLTLFLTVALMSSVGWSATCTYTKDQEIVRSAENLQDIRRFPSSVNVNAENPCGGTLLQLAVIRGNPSIFNYLADMNSVEAMEFLKDRMEKTIDNTEFLLTMNS